MSAVQLLLLALAITTVLFVIVLGLYLRRAAVAGQKVAPSFGAFLIGTVANFFDTIGIGSFATTTTALRAGRMIDDAKLPGTLNVGYATAALFQSFLFIAAVEVDPTTLIAMMGAAIAGAWVGAGWFSKWPKRNIQLGMGAALIIAGALFIYKNAVGDPVGGNLTGVTGMKLVAAVAGNFVLGVMMTIGVGLYGPCMLLIALLGMSPRTAFPIMMGSCAFLMPIAGTRFLKENAADLRISFALALSALPGVWLAYKFFSNLDVAKLRWLVAFVVLIAGIMLIRAALQHRAPAAETAPKT